MIEKMIANAKNYPLWIRVCVKGNQEKGHDFYYDGLDTVLMPPQNIVEYDVNKEGEILALVSESDYDRLFIDSL